MLTDWAKTEGTAMPRSSSVPQSSKTGNRTSAEIRLLAFDDGRAKEWDAFVLAHPEGTFFHQIGWKKIIEKTYGYRPQYFYAQRDGQITGIAPAFLVANWITGRSLISLPFAVYGGVCASDAESKEALLTRLEEVAASERVDYLELRSRNGGPLEHYHPIDRYATFTMPLTSDAAALYGAFPKDIRYMIRKGEKAGLTVRRGFAELDAFYSLMTLNLRRLGTPAFPRTLFANLIEEYPGQIELMLVYSNDKPLAGGMMFLFRAGVQPYYVGADEEAKAVGANNFLWWQMIKFAAESGFTEFDFGRSKKSSGNYDFKKKWKPTIESLDYKIRLVRRNTVPNFSPTNSKFKLIGEVWKKMPLSVTRILGPRIVRFFP
jgi:FemAB-related protein (PEP-CTERM system-associated)